MARTIATCYSPVNSNLLIPPDSNLLFNLYVDNKQIRLRNLLLLIEEAGTVKALGDAAETPATHLSNIKNRVKSAGGKTLEVGDKLARKLERGMKKDPGWMDVLHDPSAVEGEELPFEGKEHPVVGYVLGGDKGYYDEMAYATGHGEGYVTYPTRDKNTYALRVRGDSMRPRMQPGEYVVVAPNHAVTFGDEVVVRTKDGRVMVKKLGPKRGGVIELQSVNEIDHAPISVEEREVILMHYVAGVAKDYLYRTSM